MLPFREFCKGILELFYPNICVCCSSGLTQGENHICSHCLYELPVTDFHKDVENPVEQVFWGRADVKYATACYFYRKGNRIQQLMYEIKYKGQKDIGLILGRQMGVKLQGTGFEEVDVIVPVPLHPAKFRKRGYNQSEWIARGIAQSLDKPVNTDTLIRLQQTGSQTRKKRFERWENVHSGFGIVNEALSGKHVLLVDDVLTTGATLEACIHTVCRLPGTMVSIATLAYATN